MKIFLFIIALLSTAFLSTARADDATEPSNSIWAKRFKLEREWRSSGLALIPYRSNYFFPLAYNTSPHSTSTHDAQNNEAKFQFSVKALIMDRIFDREIGLYFGYTQLSIWQAYDQAKSSPFRETDYEPEAILTLDSLQDIGPLFLQQTDFGAVHQSNGAEGPDSRSWNRVYVRFLFDRDNFTFTVRPWWRIPDPSNRDDNPHIEKFVGYGDVEASYFLKNHIFSVLMRNNLRANGNRGALELDYSFPLTRVLTGLIQYFNGYAETLIDYNRPTNRISIGLALSNWR